MCNEKREKLLFFKFKSYISDSAVSIIKERLGKRLIKVKKKSMAARPNHKTSATMFFRSMMFGHNAQHHIW